MDQVEQADSAARRSSASRERTRSDSGKENSARSSGRNRRTSVQRYTESVMASTLAAVAALSANDDPPGDRPIDAHSPVEFGVTDSALPSDSDHGAWGDQHSSEEELECINETAMLERESDAQVRANHNHNRVTALRFGPSAFGPPGDGDAKAEQSVDHRQKRSASNPQQVNVKRPIYLD